MLRAAVRRTLCAHRNAAKLPVTATEVTKSSDFPDTWRLCSLVLCKLLSNWWARHSL
jgi:hypothetical protein